MTCDPDNPEVDVSAQYVNVLFALFSHSLIFGGNSGWKVGGTDVAAFDLEGELSSFVLYAVASSPPTQRATPPVHRLRQGLLERCSQILLLHLY